METKLWIEDFKLYNSAPKKSRWNERKVCLFQIYKSDNTFTNLYVYFRIIVVRMYGILK